MELFLNNSWESQLIELFVHYTNSSKRVNVIKLSSGAQALIKTGTISLQVPSLVASESEYLTTAVAICSYLAALSGTKGLLFGEDYKLEAKNISYLEIVTKGQAKEFVQVLNQELETKTYFVGTHITFADLAVFIASYKYMTSISDDEKWGVCNFFRWFNHIQNLPGIAQFLQSHNLPQSTFPSKPKASTEGKAKKEKKIGTQAPPKQDKKQQQQKPAAATEQKGASNAQQAQLDKAAEKKAKKEQQKQQQSKKAKQVDEPLLEPTDPMFFEQNLDIRVGEIKKVWKHPESDKLWCEEIDVGEPELRQIASGLQEIIPIEGMTGKVCVMTNLKPRPLRGFKSNGMVMCASSSDKSVVQILRPPVDAKIGDRVRLVGLEDKFRTEPLALQNDKKKILEKAFPLLKADGEKCATYAGVKFTVAGGHCTTEGVANGTVA